MKNAATVVMSSVRAYISRNMTGCNAGGIRFHPGIAYLELIKRKGPVFNPDH